MKKFLITAITALTLTVSSTAFAQDTAKAPTPAYMIGSYDIRDEAGFQKYIEAAAPLVRQYGGRVIVYNPGPKPIVEGEPRSVIAIAEFPSLAEAERYYNSPEYTAARKFFTDSTEGWRIITEGADLPQQ
ncbi:DUF1330 domain-containing protein [Rhizobium lentis]|uniref:Uncharacterized protein (DUF1330 family) n=1 Tax=Rhizobium lentis TaxID=1138194 RepID=A0A7W8XKT9_9HYPH|nr:DUF1330 domain-containing protein [Rhizobium lentis]MBB4577566.1 uncharacterized protein (DUF1330 family) [Rhizobium lentis]MBB5554127.1 uncharacterized protein (DUF1330 family) [Rhizobium lentis]MBB5564740.1 uncharacterized protein (DUF1330 family) [Rhizobium lentis]MBB5571243.1 uncharacterized protein (DUF1330 family) [Rhizobium lentis]